MWKYGVGAAAAISRTTSPTNAYTLSRVVQSVFGGPPIARERLRRRAVAAQIGIRHERRVDVPRHVDLGHDRDVARPRVRDDVGVLLLRVESAAPATDLRQSTDGREVRPRLDLDAPPLIVGEMQVQPIQLVERVQIDEALDVVGPEKVARDVEHRAAPLEARHVDDVRRGHDQPRDSSPPGCSTAAGSS